MKKVLITGATGFIGSHLVKRIIQDGNDVRILALPGDEKAADYDKNGIDVVYGDIADEKAVGMAVSDIQVVYHLAGIVSDWAPKQLYKTVNIQGTENICRCAIQNGVERLVYISTNDVFGFRDCGIIDESFPYRPWREPYSDSKLKASNIVWKYHRLGLPATMIYPCWVYGPGDTTFLVPLVDAIKKGQLVYWRKNSLVWPAYINNVVDLLIEVGSSPAAVGQGFLVHDGVYDTFENFVARIADSLNLRRPRMHVPYYMALSTAWAMQNTWRLLGINSRPLLTTYVVKNLGAKWKFSIAKAKEKLNWKPSVNYHDGLSTTINWLKEII
jgi:nucleoside-diphosphate-sugar epimerase